MKTNELIRLFNEPKPIRELIEQVLLDLQSDKQFNIFVINGDSQRLFEK
jgi:hypothetical protein